MKNIRVYNLLAIILLGLVSCNKNVEVPAQVEVTELTFEFEVEAVDVVEGDSIRVNQIDANYTVKTSSPFFKLVNGKNIIKSRFLNNSSLFELQIKSNNIITTNNQIFVK